MIKFFISSNPNNLRVINPDVTVEAEYGDDIVEGSIATLAHHGARAMNPAPCLYKNGLYNNVEIVGLSHIDLDTIGGCMAIMGIKPENQDFWVLAGFVDVAGPHKMNLCNSSDHAKLQLQAYWAWSKNHRVFAPKDGSVIEVTNEVMEAACAINEILNNNPKFLEMGESFQKGEELLNKECFVDFINNTVVRVGHDFCNHMYNTPDGEVGNCVVSYNTITGAITLSFSDSDDKRNACEIMQIFFGKLAGGHKGVAGSPRGKRMTLRDVNTIVNFVTYIDE